MRFLWGGHLVQRVRIASLITSSSSSSLVCRCRLVEGFSLRLSPSFGMEGSMRFHSRDERRVLVSLRCFVDGRLRSF